MRTSFFVLRWIAPLAFSLLCRRHGIRGGSIAQSRRLQRRCPSTRRFTSNSRGVCGQSTNPETPTEARDEAFYDFGKKRVEARDQFMQQLCKWAAALPRDGKAEAVVFETTLGGARPPGNRYERVVLCVPGTKRMRPSKRWIKIARRDCNRPLGN